MITFQGHDATIKNIYDNNQQHVFSYWDDLSDSEKESLLQQLQDIDFNLLQQLFSKKQDAAKNEFKPAPYIALPQTDAEKTAYAEAKTIGEEYIKQGKAAAFLVAGGQGSRLGYDGPKGKFPVAPVSEKTLFQIHAEKIAKYNKKYATVIPWLIMTSNANHDDTVSYLEENNYFGLNKETVKIFPQNMIPSMDTNGKLILESKNSIFKNPDGHGGSLTALHTSGTLDYLKQQGIELVSYFQVDNPLVKILDPVFIGFHIKNEMLISSKAVAKAYAEEKVGVFVQFADNSLGVMEYSDLSDEQIQAKDAAGNILFTSGSIAIHLFSTSFIADVTSGTEISLPFHTAKKKIKAFEGDGVTEIDGFKFEKFVFDALPLTEKNIVFETVREEEFAPVKNARGVDSVDTAQELMSNLHKSWLQQKGITINDDIKFVEISPKLAVAAEDLPDDVKVPFAEKVYIE